MKFRFSLIPLAFLCVMAFSNARLHAESAPGQAEPGAMAGRVLIKGGGPLAGGRVLFYDATMGPALFLNSQVRSVPLFRAETDNDGRFWAELPPGRYYIQAVKKLPSKERGLQEGDYLFPSLDESGKPKEYIIKSGTFLDIGTISGNETYKKIEQPVGTAIEGYIIDMNGKVVEGATVFAFTDPSTAGRPLFKSQPSGADGKYILGLKGGTYYLQARSRLGGGPPEIGDIVGIFGEQTATGITVKDGEVKQGINIKVIRFRGRGPGPGQGPKGF